MTTTISLEPLTDSVSDSAPEVPDVPPADAPSACATGCMDHAPQILSEEANKKKRGRPKGSTAAVCAARATAAVKKATPANAPVEAVAPEVPGAKSKRVAPVARATARTKTTRPSAYGAPRALARASSASSSSDSSATDRHRGKIAEALTEEDLETTLLKFLHHRRQTEHNKRRDIWASIGNAAVGRR